MVFHICLVIGPDGVEYRNYFVTYFTPWNNVKKIDYANLEDLFPFRRYYYSYVYRQFCRVASRELSLILDEPAEISARSRFKSPIAKYAIPLFPFSFGWRFWAKFKDTSLGQEIRHYLPDLFDEYQRKENRTIIY